jgi:glycosyltransferase involved in cell wall biosynthesis
MKKFSFVIPAYNSKIMLKNSLEALNRQKGYGYGQYEVIVVDDGSNDGTWKYIKGVNKNYELKYIYLEREDCSCRSRARNFGWKAAEGEVIVFIDADIIVKNTHLLELERFYRRESNLALIGLRIMLPRGVIIDFDNLYQTYGFDRRKLTLLDKTYFIYNLLSYNINKIRSPGILYATNNCTVPRKILESVGGFDEKYIGYGYEDQDLACRLLKLDNIKFALNHRLEVFHQYHPHRDYVEEEFKANGKLFFGKFPFTEGNLPMTAEVDIWGAMAMTDEEFIRRFEISHQKSRQVLIEHTGSIEIEQVKTKIVKLSQQEGLDIIVNDYVEQDDLDVWIQLMGKRKSTPKYFPMSKKIGKITAEEKKWIKFYQDKMW